MNAKYFNTIIADPAAAFVNPQGDNERGYGDFIRCATDVNPIISQAPSSHVYNRRVSFEK